MQNKIEIYFLIGFIVALVNNLILTKTQGNLKPLIHFLTLTITLLLWPFMVVLFSIGIISGIITVVNNNKGDKNE